MIRTNKQAYKTIMAVKKKSGWSLREIGRATDVSHTTIRRIVSNKGDTGVTETTRAKLDVLTAIIGEL